MSDIVERLRRIEPWMSFSAPDPMRLEAADEIKRLRAALTDVLKHFKQYEDAECCKRVYAQARRALEPQHASDCAVHNAPALPAGPCDCRALEPKPYPG